MKVKDLIEKLSVLDQNAEVIVKSSNFEVNADVPVSFVHQYNTGSKKNKQFRDAFDGEVYSAETWSILGGDIPVVMIE